MENSNVKSLQALVILAIDITGTSNGPPGWNLLALITRSVVQLGLAVEATSSLVSPNLLSIYTLRAIVLPEPETWIEDESRRRLFWMIYLLDRYGTIATAFDFALDDKEIDRKLPCRDDLFSRNQPVETRWFGSNERTDHTADRPENLGSFSFYCEVLGILSSVHQFLKRPVDITALQDVERWQRDYRDLDSKLNLWKYGLPIEFGNGARLFQPGANKQITCMWVMLHVTYHTVVIRLHSSAAYPTTRSPIFTPSYSAMMRCLSAVDAIVDLTKFVTENNMLDKLGPPFAFSLWVCSRLLLVHGSTVDHRVKSEIFLFVNTLSQIGQYWQVAKRYTQLLARVLDEYQQTQKERTASVNSSDVNETPASMHILADMRRTAFDLDFLISHQPKLPIRNSVNLDSAPNRSPYPSAMANATTSNIIQNPPSTSRTPLPNELEYLDVFDFFNMPRLPTFGLDTGIHSNTNNGHGLYENRGGGGGAAGGFHNIMDFMVPNPESDWFLKS
ncbi:putative c6 transcription factor [Phaeomoniella chlamydospora]|uniref:Putative c6 transcription factor n=1 Tax=Phaeomoniella chlamydospora TaxID=158046 RepID=A0A0G2F471_PHACM|nr:putative c6 transcription factor [Phaeomoniella chlamydospora]